MPIAAVPAYLGQNFKDASPGMRFGMYLAIWTDRSDQEAQVKKRAEAKSKEGQEVAEMLRREGMDATIAALRNRERNRLPGLWEKNDHAARKAWDAIKKLSQADKALMQAFAKRQEALGEQAEVFSLKAETTAPFTTGLGNEHPLENGFAFLWPYGLPYLPGSGVKGVARRAAQELASGLWEDDRDWKGLDQPCYEIEVGSGKDKRRIELSVLDVLFGREPPQGDSDAVRGALSFWDVIPQIAGDSLMVEVMTPHQSHYYQQKRERRNGDSTTPHDSGQPTPIFFLTVPPGSQFTFHVVCDTAHLARLTRNPRDGAPDLLRIEDGKPRWQVLLAAVFTHAFAWLGFGAKTAVGYGAMALKSNGADAKDKAAPSELSSANEEIWPQATLEYKPQTGELTASYRGQKTAPLKGEAAKQLLAKLGEESTRPLEEEKDTSWSRGQSAATRQSDRIKRAELMRLISFLGTGDYQPVRYVWDERVYESSYVAEALVKLAGIRSAVILATEKAEQKHGERLSQVLRALGVECRFERIREGRSNEELWDNFIQLADLLRGEEPVMLDITHGFRSQPFFAGAVVAFVRAVEENPAAIRVVYGAFEARYAEGQAPVFDLTAFVELIDWTQAIDTFLSSGQGEKLAAKAEDLGRRLAKAWAEHKQGRPPQIKKFASALKAFTQALVALRLGELLLARGCHPSAARWLAEAVAEAAQDIEAHIPPLAQVLEKLRALVQPLLLEQDHLAGPAGQRALAELARLYLRLGRYAEAGVVLREGWVNLYASAEATRPGEAFNAEGRRVAEVRLKQAGHAERELMGLRNDIEHGGFRKKPLPAKAIREQLERFVSEFERAQPSEAAPPKPGAVWFVSRHPGAVEWARRQGIRVDRLVDHLEIDQVQESDVVIGTLPVHLAAAVSARGARFLNLSLDLPPDERGKELSTDDLERFGARLEEYRLERIGEHRPASI
ncbi:MAG: hypothetical protein KatS3mg123_2300 [Burkholderiales bacterium]|nr:MAG: hypothetical protein KatS3mg123_2300 [Burkholderiales bacterium]